VGRELEEVMGEGRLSGGWGWFRRRLPAPSPKQVLVSLKNDRPMRGALLELSSRGIMLDKAAVVGEAGILQSLPEPGRVFIYAHRVVAVQYLPDDVIQ